MTTVTQIMLKVQTLPEDQQQQVLDFIDKLPPPPPQAHVPLHGLLAGYDISDEEIAEARREMWGNSPGEDY